MLRRRRTLALLQLSMLAATGLAACRDDRLKVGVDRDGGAGGVGGAGGRGTIDTAGAGEGGRVSSGGSGGGSVSAGGSNAGGATVGRGAGGSAGAPGAGGNGNGNATAIPNRVLKGASNRIVEFPSALSGSEPFNIATGADGRLWQTSARSPSRFGTVTRGGYSSSYVINASPITSIGIVAGPDGSMWTTHGADGATIRSLALDGSVKEFPIAGAVARYIVVGPDGALWFTDGGRNMIGRITTAGVATAFAIPTAASDPMGIAAGPDGALWFTETAANKLGRIAIDGTITELAIPTAASAPQLIAAGPDGALWFTERDGNKVGRVAIDGTITELDVPAPGSKPAGITAGPDGAIWFTESGTDAIARLDLSGSFTEFVLDHRGSKPWGITAGPDGNIWFTAGNLDASPLVPGRVGRLTPESKPFTRLGLPDVVQHAIVCQPSALLLQITNSGITSSGRLAVDLDPANPRRSDYAIDDQCTGVALDPGQSCTIDVALAPSITSGGRITISVKPELGDLYELQVSESGC